jgi:hypothetical protein
MARAAPVKAIAESAMVLAAGTAAVSSELGRGCSIERGEGKSLFLPTIPQQLRLAPPPRRLPSSFGWRWRGVRGEIWRVLGPQGHGQRFLGYRLFV